MRAAHHPGAVKDAGPYGGGKTVPCRKNHRTGATPYRTPPGAVKDAGPYGGGKTGTMPVRTSAPGQPRTALHPGPSGMPAPTAEEKRYHAVRTSVPGQPRTALHPGPSRMPVPTAEEKRYHAVRTSVPGQPHTALHPGPSRMPAPTAEEIAVPCRKNHRIGATPYRTPPGAVRDAGPYGGGKAGTMP